MSQQNSGVGWTDDSLAMPPTTMVVRDSQLEPTTAFLEHILATLARLEARLEERERRASTLPPPWPDPDPYWDPPTCWETPRHRAFQEYSSYDLPHTFINGPDLYEQQRYSNAGPQPWQTGYPPASLKLPEPASPYGINTGFHPPHAQLPNLSPLYYPHTQHTHTDLHPSAQPQQHSTCPNVGCYPPGSLLTMHQLPKPPTCWDPPEQRLPGYTTQPRPPTCWDPPGKRIQQELSTYDQQPPTVVLPPPPLPDVVTSSMKKVTSYPGPDGFYLKSLDSAFKLENYFLKLNPTEKLSPTENIFEEHVTDLEKDSEGFSSCVEIDTLHEISEFVKHEHCSSSSFGERRIIEKFHKFDDQIINDEANSDGGDDGSFNSFCDSTLDTDARLIPLCNDTPSPQLHVSSSWFDMSMVKDRDRSTIIDSCIKMTDIERESIQRPEEAARWIQSFQESTLKPNHNHGDFDLSSHVSQSLRLAYSGKHSCTIDWTVYSSSISGTMKSNVIVPSPWNIFCCQIGLRLLDDSKDQESHTKGDDHTTIMAVGVIEAISEAIFHTQMFLGPSRLEWDFCFHKGSVIEHLDGQTDIVHKLLYHNRLPLGMKRWDLLLRRYWRKEDDGTYVILYHSVSHLKCPPKRANVRTCLKSGGYVISPVNQGKYFIDRKFRKKSYLSTSSARSRTISMLGRYTALRELCIAKVDCSSSDFSSDEFFDVSEPLNYDQSETGGKSDYIEYTHVADHLEFRQLLCPGAVDMKLQLDISNKGVHIVVATPSQLRRMVAKKKVNINKCRCLTLVGAEHLEELAAVGSLVQKEVVDVFLGPFFAVLMWATNKILLGKVKSNLFDELENRKVVLELHEQFLKLERGLEPSGIEICILAYKKDDDAEVPQLMPVSFEDNVDGGSEEGTGDVVHAD